jgi:NRPS condensation-like uncharacterized protein
MSKKAKKWYRLDNAAKIFPPTTDKYDTKTFRFSVSLKENVDGEILQKALDSTLVNFPIFLSTLKRGFFWYYLEETDIKPKVTKEDTLPCDYMDYGILFRVSYFKKRINLEVSHALTDGTGTEIFLKSLTANYLEKKHNIKDIEVLDTSSTNEKNDDSFHKYYKRSKRTIYEKKQNAHHIKGRIYPEDHIKIIEGLMPVKDVLALSKKYNTTLTVYLTSLLIESIGLNMSIKERKNPIYITVPVNLRKYFPSDTVRNFFNTISIVYKVNEEINFDDIIEEVDKQFKKNLTKEVLDEKMNSLAALENIFIIRLVPIIIKDFVLKYSYKISRKYHTMTLSNIGIITMPKEFDKYIDYFDVFTSTDGVQACMCTYRDNLTISFTSHFVSAEIEKNFFRKLSSDNINIQINTNIVEEDEEDEEML